jgi:O-antigen/teichoic acid export membrane protein
LGQVVSAILAVLVARQTTPAALGEFFVIIGVLSWGMALADYGYASHATRELSANRMPVHIYWSGLALRQGIAGVLGLAACTAAVIALPQLNVALVYACLLAAWLQLAQLGVGAALRTCRMFTWLAVSSAVSALLMIGVFMALISLGCDPVASLPLSSSATVGVSIVISLVALSRRMPFSRFSWVNPWSDLHGFGLFSIAVSVSGLDVPALGAVSGASAAGEFGIARRLLSPVLIAAAAINLISLQEASRASSGLQAFRRLRALWPIVVGGLLVSVSLGVFAPVLVPFVLGPEYGGMASTLTITALAGALSLVNSIAATSFNALGHDKLVAFIMWVSVAAQFATILWLGPTLGALGAAISFVALQAIFLAGMVVSFWRFRRATWRDWRSALMGH